MYTVELKSGFRTGDTNIHSFLTIKDPDGNEESWGFYPEELTIENIIDGPGEVKSDNDTATNATSGEITITEQQYNDLKGFIQDSRDNPPPYSIPLGSHCTTWALEGLAQTGIIPRGSAPDFFREDFLTDISQTIQYNPFQHYIEYEIHEAIDRFYGGIDGIYETFRKFFSDLDPSEALEEARNIFSPIVFDLDGDGIETISQSEGAYFDHDKNGLAEKTGWVDQDDGLLVLDRNQDGIINDGSELFGNNTELESGGNAENGYKALAELDSNQNNVIDRDDSRFGELKIWRDLNSDGISQQNELSGLDEFNITSIDLAYNDVQIDDGHGNTIKQTSTAFTSISGVAIETADVWFSADRAQTVDRNTVELSDELLSLPEAVAFGNVRSLRQSMVADEVLTD